MLSATVAQNPTMPVRDGTKKCRNSLVVLNLLGVLKTGPKPPAFLVIHHSSSKPTASMNGAPTPSKNLMVSMPRQITAMFSSQKAKKQIQGVAAWAAAVGSKTRNIEKMACPPIQH